MMWLIRRNAKVDVNQIIMMMRASTSTAAAAADIDEGGTRAAGGPCIMCREPTVKRRPSSR